jgi:PTH1 family peptidyl-tRNA hydrolase
MKFLIVGLGNIGAEYKNTRHNIGFDVLDHLAENNAGVFVTDRLADVCTIKNKGKQFVLVKPSTYMNLSGKAVNYWMQKEKIELKNVFIITDDIALPLGKIRIRAKGSDGGHNGLKNIIEVLGTSDYIRLRFGVGNDFGKGQQVDYVLGKWAAEEQELLKATIKKSAEAVLSFGHIGLERTMNFFNTK